METSGPLPADHLPKTQRLEIMVVARQLANVLILFLNWDYMLYADTKHLGVGRDLTPLPIFTSPMTQKHRDINPSENNKEGVLM